jgi:sterol desaturase/sphingolipid hydroxylase (fatty acid hydroxylase superfamily)
VILFEIILNGATQFNHGNIFIPEKIDSYLRLALVTPDMHRVHHSIIPKETNSNFGFALPWWDFIMGTYRSAPENGHTEMLIGLKDYRDSKKLLLWHLLANPFKK